MAGTDDDAAVEGGTSVYGPFSHVTAPNSGLYRRVMQAMLTAKERFTVHLRAEQVHEALLADGGETVSEETVASALDRLADDAWGNLHAFPDASRVTALEDFYRRRMLYQLSRAGEAAERALAAYDIALGRRGALQSVALEDIVVLLTNLRLTADHHAEHATIDAAATHQALRNLRERFSELAENAVAFMGSIQRTIDLHDADVEAFLAYKERLIDYLERFISDLLVRGASIAELLGSFTAEDVDLLLTTAAERESLDAAPGEEDAAATAARETWHLQWAGLTDWFVSTSGRDSEAKLLRARARAAIPALLAVVRALHDSSGGRTDRSHDFLTLARWFATMENDGDRHRLWRSAFGLTSTRHLSVTSTTEDAWEAAELGNATPWADAPPVEISAQLRRTGTYERRGRATRVIDRTQAKEHLLSQARQQHEQTAAARRRILTGGPKPLSSFGVLDEDAFGLFLGLLGDALSSMGPTATTAQVQTSDGELTVTLIRTDGDGVARIATPYGQLSGPDHLVDIASTVEPVPARRER